MPHPAPVRFEEIAFNYGFIPLDPSISHSYCMVYRLFNTFCIDQPGNVVLLRGNEWVIQMKDISGPLEEREKYTIYCQDIVDYYAFNFRTKVVGFLIQAQKRSKTGYWFVLFQREGQLLAFCKFLYWVINGRVPTLERSLSPHSPRRRSPYRTSQSRQLSPPRRLSRPRSNNECTHSSRYGSRCPGHDSMLISYNPRSVIIDYPEQRRYSRAPSSTYLVESTIPSYRRTRSASREWY